MGIVWTGQRGAIDVRLEAKFAAHRLEGGGPLGVAGHLHCQGRGDVGLHGDSGVGVHHGKRRRGAWTKSPPPLAAVLSPVEERDPRLVAGMVPTPMERRVPKLEGLATSRDIGAVREGEEGRVTGVVASRWVVDATRWTHGAVVMPQAGKFLVRSENISDAIWREITNEICRDADYLFKIIGKAYSMLSDPTIVSITEA
uniref:Uncharacterized protein n=1 Tax=Setaria viridis TaxID=4556 RepID=A0A4U6UFQ8_SETVI|nr:hypothetical protein SEVIR_5G042900v2 [Setaria viridis]